MRVGLVGCGLAGTKRAFALGGHRLVWTADKDQKRASALARKTGARAAHDWRESLREVDAVIVSTTHDALSGIARAALEAGRHVLVEKPGALGSRELEALVALAARKRVRLKVGFNHRYHPAFLKARKIVDAGGIGEMMFVRAVYGHGGRLGYEKEWRADPRRSGGGQLMDQGVHLIDLSRWFLGRFTEVSGFAPTYFWDMRVDDNAFLLLKTPEGRAAWLHASWTEWKNLFSFEIFGKRGKLKIDGLGGSYGVETLTYYRMSPRMGIPRAKTWRFPGPDRSWGLEFADFVGRIRRDDSAETLKIVEKVYRR